MTVSSLDARAARHARLDDRAARRRRVEAPAQGARPHVLGFRVVDPGLVVEKLVVNTGHVRPGYLGPPESYRHGLPRRD
jgi:hypothetical protein